MSMRANSTAAAPSAEDVVQKVIEFRDGMGRRLPLVVSNVGNDVVLSLGVNPQTTTVLTPAGAEQLGMALLSASGRWRSLDGLAEAPPPAARHPGEGRDPDPAPVERHPSQGGAEFMCSVCHEPIGDEPSHIGAHMYRGTEHWHARCNSAKKHPPRAPAPTQEAHACSGCGCTLDATMAIWTEGSQVYCDHACKEAFHAG